MCLDLKGAFKIKSLYPREAVTVFVSPPSLEDLKERICKRCRKTLQKEVKDRLRLAGREVSFAGRYDYRLVNDDLRQVTRELKAIVLKKIKDWEGR